MVYPPTKEQMDVLTQWKAIKHIDASADAFDEERHYAKKPEIYVDYGPPKKGKDYSDTIKLNEFGDTPTRKDIMKSVARAKKKGWQS